MVIAFLMFHLSGFCRTEIAHCRLKISYAIDGLGLDLPAIRANIDESVVDSIKRAFLGGKTRYIARVLFHHLKQNFQ